MKDQLAYYNRFGSKYAADILDCPQPALWTTDYHLQGPVFREMEKRLSVQQQLIRKYFKKEFAVLDLGCGFGRQASWLADQGFYVTGTDSSEVFINIARELFRKKGFRGDFYTTGILEFAAPMNYSQVLLLDVLEHIPPRLRTRVTGKISSFLNRDGVLIISVPHVRKRFTSYINNRVLKSLKGRFSYFRNREEHPFTIPGRKQVQDLCDPFFILEEFMETPLTDYYIFRKKQ